MNFRSFLFFGVKNSIFGHKKTENRLLHFPINAPTLLEIGFKWQVPCGDNWLHRHCRYGDLSVDASGMSGLRVAQCTSNAIYEPRRGHQAVLNAGIERASATFSVLHSRSQCSLKLNRDLDESTDHGPWPLPRVCCYFAHVSVSRCQCIDCSSSRCVYCLVVVCPSYKHCQWATF